MSNRSGTLPLFLPSRRKAGSQSDSLVPQPWGMSNTSVKVPVVTLDEIVKEHVNLLMVDTQVVPAAPTPTPTPPHPGVLQSAPPPPPDPSRLSVSAQ